MTDLLERSIHLINNYVSQWTKKYLFYTNYEEETSQGHTFVTVFSMPTPSKPIPIATVKVYFYVPDLTDPSEKSMSFRFENDSLIHLVSRTIRLSQMEKWIETILMRKDRTCRIMFLGTEFEQTRIINKRMDEVLHEKRIEQEKENPQIKEELLEFPTELINQFTISEEEQKRELILLTELLYQTYRQIDTEDLGMISFEECKALFKLMGLELGRQQQEDIVLRLDNSRTGIIQFKDLSSLGIEIIHSIYCQNLALKELREKEEESRFEAQWMLYEELMNISQKIVEECKLRDEEEHCTISQDQYKAIIEELHKFSENEIERLMLAIKDQEPYQYAKTSKLLEDTIFEYLVKGLLEAHKSKLELFLIDLFTKLDQENKGKIKLTDMMMQLKTCEKVKLSRAQFYALQSYIKRDDKGLVDYKDQSRKISAVIKKYFNQDLVEQKNKLVLNPTIEQYIPLKTEQEIQESIKNVGS